MKEDHVTRLRQKVISLLASFLMVISLFPTNTVLAQEQYTYEAVAVTNPQADSVESSGEGGDGGAEYAFDNNYSTQWHTNWSDPSEDDKSMPHWISWQLTDPAMIGRIDYVGKPGANGVGNGVFKDISVYVTEDSSVQPNETGDGWTLVQDYSEITYSAMSGADQNRTATFTFTPVMASKVLIVVNGSYSVPGDPDGENVFANAREIITYKATPIDSEPEPTDDLRINVTIDGESYEGKSIQEIVEDNGISKSAVKEFAVTGGNLEYADLEFIGNGNTFYFANLQNLTIDLNNATMYDADGNVTTELPSNIFGTIKDLRELHLPGVTKIGNSNFKQAGALNGIEVLEIPDVVEIGNRAFQGGKFATSYKTLDLANVEVIGDLAFDCVNSFNTVNLDSIKVLGDTAIDAEVSSLTMPGTITSLGHNAIIIADGGQVVFEGDTPPETPTVSGWYPFGDHKFTLVSDSTAFKEAYEEGKFGKVENVTWQGPSDPIESLYEVVIGLNDETIDVSEYIDSPSATAPNGHYNYGKADLSELSISIKTSSKITGNVNYSINDGVGISKGSFATKDSGTVAEKTLKTSGSNHFKSVSFDFTIEGKAYGLTIHFMESVPSFDKLKELLDQANNISGEGYETESFNKFKAVRDEVQDFYDQYSVRLWQTSQSKVDEYYNTLNTALNALEKVSSVDKTKLEETIVSANSAVFAATHQVVVTDGLDELKAAIAKAETVNSDETASQEEVDAMVEELNAAITYMKEHEIQIEVLSIVSSDEDSITLEVNSDPFGEYAYVYDDEHSGMSETIEWTEEDVADGKAHITANNLENGDNFFYVHFLNRWTTSQNRYWVYVNTETGESDFGNVKDIVKPSVVLNVGEESVEITSEDTAQVVEVPCGVEALTATISGRDIGGATLTYSNESAQASVDPSADHKTVELNVQNAAGELVEGTYTVTVETGYKGAKPGGGASYGTKYSYEFSVELAKPTVDKTKLQDLYDDVKDYQSDNDYFDYFTKQLTNSKKTLDDPNATQDTVDRQYNWLNAKYYALLVSELNAKYDPENVDLIKYTTESLIPVINMWGITHGKTVPAYQENEASGNVGQMQGWHEQYLEAEKGLKLADDTTEWIGIFGEAATKQEINQGHFEVVNEEVVNVDGEDKLQLTVRFINDGLHPIYGDKLGSKDFKKFGNLKDCSIRVEAYDADMVSKMSSGLTNITETEDGVEGTYIVDEGFEYLTFRITAKGEDDPSISAGYYRIPEMPVPYVTVVNVLEDEGSHVRLKINGPLSSNGNAITTPPEHSFIDLNGFEYEFYEGKHTIVTDSYRQQDFDRVALISAEGKTTVNCLYYDENRDLQFYSYVKNEEGTDTDISLSGKVGVSNYEVDVDGKGTSITDPYVVEKTFSGYPNEVILTITGTDLYAENDGSSSGDQRPLLCKYDEYARKLYEIEGTMSLDHRTITFVIKNPTTGAVESGVYATKPLLFFSFANNQDSSGTCFEINVQKISNTLEYDANGGEGGPKSNYTNGTNITIRSETPTRDGYEFVGWNTKADGSGTTYQPKSSYPIDPNGIGGQKVTLYAMWQKVITLTPEENLTGYTGGDSLNDTSFPNMRYTISLPKGVDASSGITLHYTDSEGEKGTTTIGGYLQGLSLLAEGEDANITEQPVLIPELEPSYKKLDGEEVDDDSEPGVYNFEVENDEDLYAEINGKKYTVNVDDKDTTITVRYVSDPERMSDENTDYINDVVNVAPTAEVEEATAVTDPNTTYLTNDKEDIAVMNENAVGLLVDELLSDDDDFNREEAMLEKLNGFLDGKDLQTVSEGNYDFMYLDLVNTKDGNAWVSSTNGTDIYLPYPEGTDKNTQFNVVHFPGLHREYGFKGKDEVGVAIENCNPELVSIEKTDQGIKFHIGQSGFSPFALTWSDSKTEFDVSYVFKSEDGRVLPQEVNALLPTAQTATEGSTVSPQALTTTSITTAEGVWTFKGWDQQSVAVSQDVVFTGTWSFTANPNQPIFDLSDMNTTIEQGSKFDPLAGIHATDAQGNDITGSIKVVSNNVNTSKPGKYTVTYEVADQYGNISHVTVEFTVKAKETGGSQTANKDDLKDLIDKADKLDADKYTKDSWNALEKALEQAKNVYKDLSATTEEINSAYNALNNAMKNLKKVSEKGNDANTAAQMNAALYGGIAIVALGAMLICIRKRSKKS